VGVGYVLEKESFAKKKKKFEVCKLFTLEYGRVFYSAKTRRQARGKAEGLNLSTIEHVEITIISHCEDFFSTTSSLESMTTFSTPYIIMTREDQQLM
jgi:hypothetical protein